MQRGLVVRAAPDDDGQLVVRDELLEVERLGPRGDVLRGNDGALDDEDVELRVQRDLVVSLHALRRQRGGRDDAAIFDLTDALVDQVFFDRLEVDLLHPVRRLGVGERGDLFIDRVGILVTGPETFEVEHGQPAELPDLDRRLRGDGSVHRGGEQGQRSRVRRDGTIEISSNP